MLNGNDSRPSSEDEPLLSAGEGNDQNRYPDYQKGRKRSSLNKLILYFMAIHFLLAFTEIILIAPLIKLFENSLCRSYYDFPSHGIPEDLCKVPDIQRPLATIRGWKSTFDTFPVLIAAIPMGKLGDRYGRKKILALALIGVFGSLLEIFIVCAFPQIFPLKMVWLSSVILLCGGGLNSASAYMWAMASEVIPSASRSYAFYYIFSAFYVAELLSSYIASLTMDISPWIPLGLAIFSVVSCMLVLWLVPHSESSGSPGDSRNVTEGTADLAQPDSGDVSLAAQPTSHEINGLISALSNGSIILILPVFLVGIFRYTTLNVLIQYASVRFGLRISTGATFYTETAIINIILFLFAIPRITEYLRIKRKVRPEVMDLMMVRASVLLMCFGSLAIGLSQSAKFLPLGVLCFAAGFGSRVSALSLVSYWISDDAKATLYAAITVLESLGHAVGDPGMQHIFAASLSLPPFWQALPFFVGAGLYGIAAISTSFLHASVIVAGNTLVEES